MLIRLAVAQVETLIKSQESESQPTSRLPQPSTTANQGLPESLSNLPDFSSMSNTSPFQHLPDGLASSQTFPANFLSEDPNLNGDSSWEIISLGLEEPLPTKEVVDDL